jgi:hypothetical protein
MFLLDPDSAARRVVARALLQVAALLTPTEVRRLIAMRSWRPENERTEVDAVIRKARGAGIDCAQWEAGSIGQFSPPPSTVLDARLPAGIVTNSEFRRPNKNRRDLGMKRGLDGPALIE